MCQIRNWKLENRNFSVSLFLCLAVLCLLTACNGRRGQTIDLIPTPAEIDPLATAIYLTENAPPPGYRDSISFPQVDAGLNALDGWRYQVQLEFDGVFARTPRETTANATAEIWYKQVGSARRVVVSTSGELIGREDNAFEAVRLGPSAFLVRDNTCSQDTTDAITAADLRAGTLVGGVNHATPTGRRAIINGQEAWQYAFTTADLNLPSIRLSNEGSMAATGGEIWIAPAHNAVIRFYVNLTVDNAIIFDRQLPVSGSVILRYDLYDIGQPENITVPFGC
jgi:hypothetical protein